MSLSTVCLYEQEAKRLLYLEDAHQNCLLKIDQKQQLVSIYTKLVQAFDSVDPGVQYYFMQKLHNLVVKNTLPTSGLSQASIISKLKKTNSSFLTKSIINVNKSGGSFLIKDKFIQNLETQDQIEDTSTVIENQYKILQQIQEQKQQNIKISLSSQQKNIAKRLQQRRDKSCRRSAQKQNNNNVPLLKKEDLKKMQKDITKKLKRVTARLSKIQSLKAFSQKLVNNPVQLQKLRRQVFQDKIQEQQQELDIDD